MDDPLRKAFYRRNLKGWNASASAWSYNQMTNVIREKINSFHITKLWHICFVHIGLLHFEEYNDVNEVLKGINPLTSRVHKNVIYTSFICYIFVSVFCISKREHLWNEEKCFQFHFESSFRSWNNQTVTFEVFKFHDAIKFLSMKQETHFTK